MPNSALPLANFQLVTVLFSQDTFFFLKLVHISDAFPIILSLFLSLSGILPFPSVINLNVTFSDGFFVAFLIPNPCHNLLHSSLSFFFMALTTKYMYMFVFHLSPLAKKIALVIRYFVYYCILRS